MKTCSLYFDGVAREIMSRCHVSAPGADLAEAPVLHEVAALWDTGATHCAIKPRVAAALGLQPIRPITVIGVHGPEPSVVYLLDLHLPNRDVIRDVNVTRAAEIAGGFDMLIGMDVITLGDFLVCTYQGKTTFSFRMPSKGPLDFVAEQNQENRRFFKTLERNGLYLLKNQHTGVERPMKGKQAEGMFKDGWQVVRRIK